MSHKFNTIADINDMKETWKLAVRITSLSYVHNPSRPEYIEMILMDAKGDKIEAVKKNYDLDKWKSKMKEDSTYILQNFEVQINDGHYKKCDHPFKLIFMKGTTPKEQDLPEIPQDVYCFKKFEDILNGNMCSDFLVDVIGELYELGRPQADTRRKKVVFTMRDLSGNILSYTLWEEYASKFQSFHESHKTGPMVIILTLAKIKEPEEFAQLLSQLIKDAVCFCLSFALALECTYPVTRLCVDEDMIAILIFHNHISLQQRLMHLEI